MKSKREMRTLLKTKWYIVDLDTKIVAIDYVYDRFWQAIEAERKRDRMKRFTAMRGSHIIEHAGRPWIIPLTLEEAEEEYLDALTTDRGAQ